MGESDTRVFVTAPKRLEEVVANELVGLGLAARPDRGGAWLEGGLEAAYRACLWSRTGSRVLWPLHRFQAPDTDALYRACRELDWAEQLPAGLTFAVDGVLVRSALGHSRFAALRVKDAVVDELREVRGERPDVDTREPDLQLNLHVEGTAATLSVDLSRGSLHRRGYRSRGAAAPLKENLAAALLLLAGWPELAREGHPFLDPMCGSGTLPIEAALWALDVAPGLLYERALATGWGGHEPSLWARLVAEARARDGRSRGVEQAVITGFDSDPAAVEVALQNAARAGLRGLVQFEERALAAWEPPAPGDGLMVVNPPYGKRLSDVEALRPLYRSIGDVLKGRFGGWTAHVLSGSRELDGEIGLRAARREPVFNGPIECRLLAFPVRARQDPPPVTELVESSSVEAHELEAFVNRLTKRAKHLDKWARRQGIACYRVYDADIPTFNAAIDRYEQALHVQEYAPPDEVDDALAGARRRALLAVLPEVLGVEPEAVYFKVRQRQRGRSQYQKQRELGQYHEVGEGGHRFWVNLTDYLDTGLFLDHRDTRARLQELASGRTFLNLFAYTGTATVYAAKGGAVRTVSVDRSRAYLEWARRNFELNGLRSEQNHLVRADCLRLVSEHEQRYGLIFLDPPTFSNAKDQQSAFDVQRDHVELLRRTVRLLEPGGVLVFSTNARRFTLDEEVLERLEVTDIQRRTLPPDFERRPNIHHVWEMRRKG